MHRRSSRIAPRIPENCRRSRAVGQPLPDPSLTVEVCAKQESDSPQRRRDAEISAEKTEHHAREMYSTGAPHATPEARILPLHLSWSCSLCAYLCVFASLRGKHGLCGYGFNRLSLGQSVTPLASHRVRLG